MGRSSKLPPDVDPTSTELEKKHSLGPPGFFSSDVELSKLPSSATVSQKKSKFTTVSEEMGEVEARLDEVSTNNVKEIGQSSIYTESKKKEKKKKRTSRSLSNSLNVPPGKHTKNIK